jgi:hypothetical protein
MVLYSYHKGLHLQLQVGKYKLHASVNIVNFRFV